MLSVSIVSMDDPTNACDQPQFKSLGGGVKTRPPRGILMNIRVEDYLIFSASAGYSRACPTIFHASLGRGLQGKGRSKETPRPPRIFEETHALHAWVEQEHFTLPVALTGFSKLRRWPSIWIRHPTGGSRASRVPPVPHLGIMASWPALVLRRKNMNEVSVIFSIQGLCFMKRLLFLHACLLDVHGICKIAMQVACFI